MARSLSQRSDDAGERVGAAEPCGVDGGPSVGFRVRGPHGAVAVGDLSLDHAGPQLALGAVVDGIYLAGIIAERRRRVS
jgi:hypothetical protein